MPFGTSPLIQREYMSLKIFFVTLFAVISLQTVCFGMTKIEYETETEGNQITLSGTAAPSAKLGIEAEGLDTQTTYADETGYFEFRLELPMDFCEYEYTLISYDRDSYFEYITDDSFDKREHYRYNTAKITEKTGMPAPSLFVEKDTRLVIQPETAEHGLYYTSADFMTEEGDVTIMRITNAEGNSTGANSEVNFLEASIAQEAVKIMVKGGQLWLYCLDNITNQTQRISLPFATYNYGEWHNIGVLINIDEGTAQIYLDNRRMLSDRVIYMALQKNYDRLFDTETAKSDLYLDNVKICSYMTKGTITQESVSSAFYSLKKCTEQNFSDKLRFYRDYFDMENVSENIFNEDIADLLFSKLKSIHTTADLNKQIAVCDILSDTDNIENKIKVYPRIFTDYGVNKKITENPEILSGYTIENNDFPQLAVDINNVYYNSVKGENQIEISNCITDKNQVEFDIVSHIQDEINLRIYDEDFEVLNQTIELDGSRRIVQTLPKSGVSKNYTLIAESEKQAGTALVFECTPSEDDTQTLYSDKGVDESVYSFEISRETDFVTDNEFGHGAPSRFIDSGKTMNISLSENEGRGNYVFSADVFVNTINTAEETSLIDIYDSNGICGGGLYLYNNCLKLRYWDAVGTQADKPIMMLTKKQWYNISLEIMPDLCFKLFIDGEIKMPETDMMLNPECMGSFGGISVGSVNGGLSLYIDNILLFKDLLNEKIGFYDEFALGDTIDLPKQTADGRQIFFTSSKPGLITSSGAVNPSDKDETVKLTAVVNDGIMQVMTYFVTVEGKKNAKEPDLKAMIDFNPDKLPVYTSENQKIDWSVYADTEDIIYRAYVKDLDLSCEFREKKKEVYNKYLKKNGTNVEFSADFNIESTFDIYIAFYSEKDRLLQVSCGSSDSMPQDAAYCKVFVWESETQKPLTENTTVYNFDPETVYVILGSGKADQVTNNEASGVCISGIDNGIWFNSDGMLTALGECTGGKVGFLDARDCSDMQRVYNRLSNLNAVFGGVLYLSRYGEDENPFLPIEICRQIDELQTYTGKFITAAPKHTPIFTVYNSQIASAADMRSDFIVVDTEELQLKNEFEYTDNAYAEIGNKIYKIFSERNYTK